MARDVVATLNEFLERFPTGGTAVVSFTTTNEKQEVFLQVRQSDDRFLTYRHKMLGQPYSVIKKQAESLVSDLENADVDCDELRDDSPDEIEYYHEFSNGIEVWWRLKRGGKDTDVKWSDLEKVKNLRGTEKDSFTNEYRVWRHESLRDWEFKTGERLAVLEI